MGLPRKVIIANDFSYVNGGQAKVAIRSAELLAAEGIEVVFFSACGPVDPALETDGIQAVCLDQTDILSESNRALAARRGIWNREARRELQALCEVSDPDSTILHCHGYAKALSPSIGPILAAGPLRSVYTLHEFFLACPNGGFYDFRRDEICERKPLGLSCLTTNCDARHAAHKAWRVARQAVAGSVGRLPSGLREIIYISQLQRKVIEPYLPSQANLYHLPNPVTVDTTPVSAKDNDVFLFIGRLGPEKGGVLFAEAAHKAGVKAVFVGDGPEQEAIAAACPGATFTGWLTSDEVGAQIGNARCLVFPSLWYECQPLVPMEALSRKVPVICGDWSAAAEVVDDGKSGIVITEPTVQALQGAIEALKDPNHPALDPVNHAVSFADAERQHLDGLLDIYETVMRKPAAA